MNFIDAFKAWVGATECPESFLEWAALSMLAAACGNRVTHDFRIGNRILPLPLNLYVIAIGPSGSGKSFAIKCITDVFDEVDRIASEGLAENEHPPLRINRFSGRITNTGLYELMRTVRRVELPDGEKHLVEIPTLAQVYLLQDELRHDVGHPDHSDQLIGAFTKMAMGGDFGDMTRTTGKLPLTGYSLNWFAGTTLDWLIGAVDSSMLNAGFLRRTVVVHEGYGTLHYPGDSKPTGDTDELFAFLAARINNMLNWHGATRLSEEAIAIDRRWYMQQEVAKEGEGSMRVHTGKHVLARKLASLLMIAEENPGRVVKPEHLITAQQLVDRVVAWQDEIVPAIQKGQVHAASDYLLNLVLSSGESGTAHTWLLRKALARFGMDTERLGKIVHTWEEAGIIAAERLPRSKGGTRYYDAKLRRHETKEASNNPRSARTPAVRQQEV